MSVFQVLENLSLGNCKMKNYVERLLTSVGEHFVSTLSDGSKSDSPVSPLHGAR